MTIYVVKSGDTVSSIAAEFGVDPLFLASDNEISVNTLLPVGRTLVVRFPARTYTIMPGDTLYSLSQKTGRSVNSLLRANLYLKGSPFLIPGERIVTEFEGGPLYELETGGYAYPFINGELLKTVLPFMEYLMPFTYGFDENGTLVELNDIIMLEESSNYGTIPYMHISTLTMNEVFDSRNAEIILDSKEKQETLIRNILVNMTEKGYYGVDVDFEYISPEYKNKYVRFLDDLTGAANERSFQVMAALAPKVYDEQPGLLYEAHDYEAIGAAVNKVLLMTYEWGYTYSEPMAVSPINNVRRVIEYALTRIPAEKIYLGMSNYGYDWKLPYIKGVTKAESLSTEEAFDLAAKYGAEILYDEEAQAPHFNYTDENGTVHEVWFEDARSLAARIELAAGYGLRGVLYWNLMRKDPQNLTVIDSLIKLNN